MTRKPEEAFEVALFHFEIVGRHLAQDLTGQIVSDAVAIRMSAGIEAMSKLDRAYLDSIFDEWPQMWGMRNRLSHAYVLADSAAVIESAKKDLPGIVSIIRSELDRLR